MVPPIIRFDIEFRERINIALILRGPIPDETSKRIDIPSPVRRISTINRSTANKFDIEF